MATPLAQLTLLEALLTLDGEAVDVADGSWWLRVCSMQRDQDCLWVQLAALGDRRFVVTLSLPLSASESPITLLEKYLREPDGDHPHVLDATPLSAWATVASCAGAVH